MSIISNTDIAYEAGETYAMEFRAGLSTIGPIIACPYDSDEMIKAFHAGFNNYIHNAVMDALELAEAQDQNQRATDEDDLDWDDNGFHQHPYER